ncbi:MAG TPA: acyl-CoA dehydrogenase family protein [Dehalococcoidia bacterium]|nr:acyl-CoA dehydrogenase family protein [Dehalococcoidia bacterium]
MTAIDERPGVQHAPAASYGAMPDTDGMNFYHADFNLGRALRRYLSSEELAHAERILTEAGEVAGGELNRLAFIADKHPPQLVQYDRRGRRVDRVEKHPAYHEMEQIAFARFALAAVSHRDGVLGWPGRMPAVMKYALSYVLIQAEFGLFCPVNMTDSLARVLSLFADEELKRAFLPRLTALDLDSLWQGAQFLTEKEGGSDVGASRTVARRDEHGDWRLSGDKWFCSNAGADLILTLARPEGAPPGTRGLGLFLVPAVLADGSRNAFTINRLKDKLGSRSMASGEYTFSGALAYQVGPLERGFKQMMEMVSASRLSNAMRAAAMMRRSYLEALVHARGRLAFGGPLAALPLMREKLMELLLDTETALAVVLQAGAALGRADAGSAHDARLIRILTPLAKWYLCKRARYVTAEAMEVRGGNGYIEDWVNARLVRDSHLGSIWEGASNVVLLDVGRAMQKEQAHQALLDDIARRLDGCDAAELAGAVRVARGALSRLRERAGRWQTLDAETQELALDGIARRLYHLNAATLLLEEARDDAAAGRGYRKLLLGARYLRSYLCPAGDEMLAEPDRSALAWFEPLVDGGDVPASAAAELLAEMSG